MFSSFRLLSGDKDFLIKDIDRDFHTHKGTIKKEDLKKFNTYIETNKGFKYFISIPNFNDVYKKITRGPQLIPLKDIGKIISTTGITKESVVADCGVGSGGLSLMLANFVKLVYGYDKREDHLKIAKKNKELLNLDNIKFIKKDIYEGIDKKDLDLITLDVRCPWNFVEHAYNSLKYNRFLVSYSPNICQVQELVNISKDYFKVIDVTEILERSWKVSGKVVRPQSSQVIHSGFLVFLKKLKIK